MILYFYQNKLACILLLDEHRKIPIIRLTLSFSYKYINVHSAAVYTVTSLRCYACAYTGRDNECQHHETYVDAVSGKRPELVKNCTPPYDKVCYIETFSGNGEYIGY